MRPTPSGRVPPVETHTDLIASFLSDAAHVPGGFAAGVAFPRDAGEVAALVTSAQRVLPVGAQSSLTGGATPRGELILSTRALAGITLLSGNLVRVGAGVPLTELQRALGAQGLYYPPVPTFDGAFVGGTIATNAAGAATFKYGSTRQWVDALTVVLADGSMLDMRRGEVTASPDGAFELEYESGRTVRIPVPTYQMPAVPKLSAGYFARPRMDLIDLFIGSEGTLASSSMQRCASFRCRGVASCSCRAVPMSRRCRSRPPCGLRRRQAGAAKGRSTSRPSSTSTRARSQRHRTKHSCARAWRAPVRCRGAADADRSPRRRRRRFAPANRRPRRMWPRGRPYFAAPGDDRAASRLLELREAVPSAINALVASAKARVDPQIQKTAADIIVPFDRLDESIALYRRSLESRGLDYALWGHLSDGNLHPNVVPRSMADVERGRDAILEMARGVIAMGGAPLAEHGVGRSALKQRLLRELYGDRGIEEMRAVKRALDPAWKLSPGVLFPEPR